MNDTNIIVIGDSFLDRYYEGDVVPQVAAAGPVIREHSSFEVPGGAANIAMSIATLGYHCHLVTVLGGGDSDDGATGLRNWFDKEKGVKLHAYHFKDMQTPIRTHLITSDGYRVARYDKRDTKSRIDAGAAQAVWNRLEMLLKKMQKQALPTVIVLADFVLGLFAETEFIHSILRLAQVAKVPVIVDTKSNKLTRFQFATLVKSGLKYQTDPDEPGMAADVAEALMRDLKAVSVQGLLLTAGGYGSALAVVSEGDILTYNIPAYPMHYFCNHQGAGDIVTALLAIHLASLPTAYADVKYKFKLAAKFANIGAGVFVEQPTPSVISEWEYNAALSKNGMLLPFKKATLEAAITINENAKENDEETVFAFGRFDNLNPGQLYLLQEARRLGDMLIVAVKSDEAIRRNKAELTVSLEHRIRMLEALDCVDLVVPYNEDTPEKLIHLLKPDVLVRGHEHFTENYSEIPGGTFMLENNKLITFVKMLEDYAATEQPQKAQDVFEEPSE